MPSTLEIISSEKLTYHQKVTCLAQNGENSVDPIAKSQRFLFFQSHGALSDMHEGNAPYRPRYIMVDFQRFIRNGSSFLRLSPPTDLDELLHALLILYAHIPSITGHPVYIGDLDTLIDPFLPGLSDDEAKKKLALFLNHIDRTIANGYCHANIGPAGSRAASLLLEVEKELQNAVPNFTLRYDCDSTPDELATQAIITALTCSNPAICNDRSHRETYPGGYGISSCYNILPIRGGAYTLSRLTLPGLAAMAESIDDFRGRLLPEAVAELGQYMNQRIKFLVEESHFFSSSFLVEEGLIDPDRFVGMYGVAGLSNCVNLLLKERGLRYGRDREADDLAAEIMRQISEAVDKIPAEYSPLTGGKFLLHAQAGLSSDTDVTPGVRIPVGDEPDNILDHLRHSARFHQYFPTGCSDIFPFEETAANNPSAILDVIKGSFSMGVKYLSLYPSTGDIVRITGFLVKRSDIEKYDKGQAVLETTVQDGSPNYKNNRLHARKVNR